MTEYQRYPLTMNHPNYWAGYTPPEIKGSVGNRPKEFEGLPARFPPVIVRNEEQEEEHAAKGYVPAGTPSPAAHSKSLARTDGIYEPEEYPKWVGDVLCQDADEEAAVRDGSYHPQPAEPPAPAPTTIEELALQIAALQKRNDELLAMVQAAKKPEVFEAASEVRDPNSITPSRAAKLFAAPDPLKPGRGAKAWETRRRRAAEAALAAEAAQQAEQPPPDAP